VNLINLEAVLHDDAKDIIIFKDKGDPIARYIIRKGLE
jgi:hypothetical protein